MSDSPSNSPANRSTRASNFRYFKELHDTINPSEFQGLRYVFGVGFGQMKDIVEIYRELVLRRRLSDDDARATIEDCIIACGYKYLLKKQCSESFKIRGSCFTQEEIARMEKRAVYVKVIRCLDERNRWRDFLDFADVLNMPQDKFDYLRELENKKELNFKFFEDILDLMEEKLAMDIIDGYQQDHEKEEQQQPECNPPKTTDDSSANSGANNEDVHEAVCFNKTTGNLIIGKSQLNVVSGNNATFNGPLIGGDTNTIDRRSSPSHHYEVKPEEESLK